MSNGCTRALGLHMNDLALWSFDQPELDISWTRRCNSIRHYNQYKQWALMHNLIELKEMHLNPDFYVVVSKQCHTENA